MSRYIRNVLTAQGAFDYATNTQSLYRRHLLIARHVETPFRVSRHTLWMFDIENVIMPAYAQEFKEPTACISTDDADKLARMLDYYYTTQIKEGA